MRASMVPTSSKKRPAASGDCSEYQRWACSISASARDRTMSRRTQPLRPSRSERIASHDRPSSGFRCACSTRRSSSRPSDGEIGSATSSDKLSQRSSISESRSAGVSSDRYCQLKRNLRQDALSPRRETASLGPFPSSPDVQAGKNRLKLTIPRWRAAYLTSPRQPDVKYHKRIHILPHGASFGTYY